MADAPGDGDDATNSLPSGTLNPTLSVTDPTATRPRSTGGSSSTSTRSRAPRPDPTDAAEDNETDSVSLPAPDSSPLPGTITPVSGGTIPSAGIPSPSAVLSSGGSSLSTDKLTAIVVPTVVGSLFLAVLFAWLVRRCRRKRRTEELALGDIETRNRGGIDPHNVVAPVFPQSDSTLRGESALSNKKKYSVDSFHPSPSLQEEYHHPQSLERDTSPASALFVDMPSPDHRVAWRPERLPDSPPVASDAVSSHSRTPSMAERRTQRLMRALQDVEPPLPTPTHAQAI